MSYLVMPVISMNSLRMTMVSRHVFRAPMREDPGVQVGRCAIRVMGKDDMTRKPLVN